MVLDGFNEVPMADTADMAAEGDGRSDFNHKVGWIMATLRDSAGLTQKDVVPLLADNRRTFGSAQGFISRVELGKQSLSLEDAAMLLRAYGFYKPDVLFDVSRAHFPSLVRERRRKHLLEQRAVLDEQRRALDMELAELGGASD
ncbi:helix-turn-helix domain-containing protein [Bifidobacterium oedipodis]|uniref:Uncharacterized protein n=1 Tax=Bifidobacterium oedipodis TaxID=2675322 RepID=A0A7Y0EP89_9BIFI|nr:helix-turn-helix transcriptional regulator [Bifidobacterium sp. DSM 109957]NMM93895.1 hypothetical protein [Bifidobacterium sp. DSM 109957]